MLASEVIRNAKAVLFERGWHQGSFQGPGGSVCVGGAVFAVEATDSTDTLSLNYIGSVLGTPRVGVASWNDKPGRTFDDVIDALDRAEKLALLAEEI